MHHAPLLRASRRFMSTVPSAAELAQRTCAPCSHKAIREQGITRLSAERTGELLRALEPGWELAPQPLIPDAPDALRRIYTFRNFATAAAFAADVGSAAEAAKHHPAVLLEWGRVAVWWWSHALSGVRVRADPAPRKRLYYGCTHRRDSCLGRRPQVGGERR